VRWPPAWELVNWRKCSVVRCSPDSNDASIEAEESLLLRSVAGKRLSESRLRRFSVCCSNL
jgi:hypothetical protein